MPSGINAQPGVMPVDYSPAPSGVRLRAFLVDGVFSGAIAKVVTVALSKFIEIELDLLVNVIIAAGYFAFPLTYNGQTLGKKIFGLKVLSSEDDRPLTLKEALMREIAGKLLSVGTFGAGFFAILVRPDGKGFHDLLSGSKVVVEATYAEKQGSVLVNMAKSASVSLMLSVVSTAVMLYSSFAASRIESSLTAQGFKVSKVTGNFINGFEIHDLKKAGAQSVEVKLAKLKFGEYLKILTEHTITIEHITAEGLIFKTNEGSIAAIVSALVIAAIPKSADDEEGVEEIVPAAPPTATQRRNRFPRNFVLKKFEVTNAQLIDSENKFEVSLARLEDFEFQQWEKSIGWKSLKINSSALNLKTETVAFKGNDLLIGAPIALKLIEIPGLKLKQPVELLASFEFANNSLKSLQINALQNKLVLAGGGEKPFQLWLTDLNLNDYLEGFPIANLNLYSAKKKYPELALASPDQGSFKIGEATFTIQQTREAHDPFHDPTTARLMRVEAIHQGADVASYVRFPPGFLASVFLGNSKLELSDSRGRRAEEILLFLGARDPFRLAEKFESSQLARVPAVSALPGQESPPAAEQKPQTP